MNEVISMSTKELDRLKVLDQLQGKRIKQKQASDALGVSERQIRGLLRRYKQEGAKGILSKKRGKSGNRQMFNPSF